MKANRAFGTGLLLLATVVALMGCGRPKGEVLASPKPAVEQSGRGKSELPLNRLRLPEGFSVSVFARVPGARSLTVGDDGTVFVGMRRGGSVWAVRDDDGDWQADRVIEIASGLTTPNGVEFRDGDLYVAEIPRILRYDDIEDRLEDPPTPRIVVDDLPTDAHHGWKFIRFGPDGLLYFPIGAPCNVCERGDPRFAAILRLDVDQPQAEPEIFASGVRNTVGFDWNPETGELFFTDNGRDHLGDDSPPDELNRATEAGLHFGFPYCHGLDVSDPEFGHERPCSEFEGPVLQLGAHVAALGMRFYDGSQFPDNYSGSAFVAEHGSWNRSSKVGYRVISVDFEDGLPVSVAPFAQGWLQGEEVWGRPVDVEVLDDGSLLVSDDFADAVYRVSYEP